MIVDEGEAYAARLLQRRGGDERALRGVTHDFMTQSSRTASGWGPVASRIVGEMLVGTITADPESSRSVDADWTPILPARRAGAFGLGDVLVP